ncbi:MAG TPA: hypothetical protein VHF27_09055 [Acidimicrobiales bacterium]|nr:hypothetical protein [Acidimicrobiales bacterium]
MNDAVLVLLNLLGGLVALVSLATMLLAIWFFVAVGLPLRDWLRRELAKDETTFTRPS